MIGPSLARAGFLAACCVASIATGQEASLIAPGETVRKLADGMGFTEGPAWLPATKTLVFSDLRNSRLMRWSEADGVALFRETEASNGNSLDLEGRLITCQHAGRNLVRTEANGTITVLADAFDGKRFNSPNDVAVRSDGTLWFTDPPWGLVGPGDYPGHWVFKLDPATGTVEPVVKDLAMPNGIAFSPDESRLYIADTGGTPRHPDPHMRDTKAGIHCYAVSPDGRIGEQLFRIDHGSDGMCVDTQGNLYTTSGGIKVHDAAGTLVDTIDVPEAPANCAFGGDDMKTLFITARTSLYSVRTVNAGAKPVGATW